MHTIIFQFDSVRKSGRESRGGSGVGKKGKERGKEGGERDGE